MRSTSRRTCFLHTTNKAGRGRRRLWRMGSSVWGRMLRMSRLGGGRVHSRPRAILPPPPHQHHGRPFSSLEVDMTPLTASPIPRHRQRTSSTPVSSSDDLCGFPFPFVASASVPGPKYPTVKEPDTFLTHRSSSPASPSNELLHLRQPLDLKVFTPKRMAAQLQEIGDDESRRLTRLAFMM
ncbi:hypothetical protein BDZ89DRAFT_380685 [Hymenopellis radicata]|nr:hypothetical protein BDZ89DRAFT_380685 [Hymenopellis radicata]